MVVVLFSFFAHTTFWAMGIFNSGGILRVMITIMPLMAIICYRGMIYGVDFIGKETVKKKYHYRFGSTNIHVSI